jgi:hypothetical protein
MECSNLLKQGRDRQGRFDGILLGQIKYKYLMFIAFAKLFIVNYTRFTIYINCYL